MIDFTCIGYWTFKGKVIAQVLFSILGEISDDFTHCDMVNCRKFYEICLESVARYCAYALCFFSATSIFCFRHTHTVDWCCL